MKALIAQLASIVNPQTDICEWENLEVGRQQAILKACTPGTTPSCIVYPHDQQQLAAVVDRAFRNKWRILTCGSGTKLGWGGLAEQIDIVVSSDRLNKLIAHAVGDLTVTVEAGMKFADLQAILANAGQFLALDPTTPESATIGGIIATANTNSWRQRYGSVRDQLLGITFVRADGKIAKAGGRVVKNVAGYDLMKLFTGSYGTLGVITQATFRLYPQQKTSTTVVLTGTTEDIGQAAATLRGSALTPTKADLLSAQLVSSLGLGTGLGLVASFQSISESVKEQSTRLLQVGEKLGLLGTILSTADEANLWQGLQEQIYSYPTEEGITCKIGVLPTAAVGVLTQVEKGLIHISSGLGVLRFTSADVNKVLQVRNYLNSNRGFLNILDAPVAVKQKVDVWGYTGNAFEVMRSIKQQFDGENILSPGRFVGGI